MKSLRNIIDTIDHSRDKRSYFANLVNNNLNLLPELLEICNEVDNPISCRAAWGLEFVCKKNIVAILPHLDHFLIISEKVHLHPAVRPMAKIVEYLTLSFYERKEQKTQECLTKKHREKMAEICFDWIITDQKVAAKAYSMTSLFLLGTEFEWIHPELKTTLENNYNKGSAAYKARARMILKKIN